MQEWKKKDRNRRGRSRKSLSAEGFTLIETLVATMILAVSLAVIMQLFSGGIKSKIKSDDYTKAVFHAREKMEEILLQEKLIGGETSGLFDDGYSWVAKVDYIEPDKNDLSKRPVDLFQISVSVLWAEGPGDKGFRLRTITIADRKAEGR
jgi:general secretion pathway protein I